jgi:hypothetical protein
MSAPKRNIFKPNLSPREVILSGSFGGTYFRPIDSSVTHRSYSGAENEFSFLKGISKEKITREWKAYDKSINKYNVKVGQTLEDWERSNWITAQDPYGWFQWYCRYYSGRRSPDDERQISRWQGLAGENGRFRRRLINLIEKKGGRWDDEAISPAIRQTLQHWGYKLTAADYEKGVKL